MRSLVRLLGIHDALLGGATTLAASAGRDATGWAIAGAIADGADLVVTVANRSRLPGSGLVVAGLSAAGDASGLSVAWRATECTATRPDRGPRERTGRGRRAR